MEIKVQATIRGRLAEVFAASMERNFRTIAGEAAYRIAESLGRETGEGLSIVDSQEIGGEA